MAAKFVVDGDQYMQIDGKFLEIKRQLRAKDGSPLDPALVSRALQSIIEGEFGASSDLPPDHYRITVTSTVQPTYAELRSAYDWVSEAWDERRFDRHLHESLRKIEPSTGEKVVLAKQFDRPTTSEQALDWAEKNDCRVLFPWEREAFTKANPDLQRKFWMIDLGSFVGDDGDRGVPVLDEGDGERGLADYWFENEWSADGRFLFVRK